MGTQGTGSGKPRWHQRYEQLARLLELLHTNADRVARDEVPADLREVVRSGVIKDFELAFELSWKTMKDYAASKAIEVLNPRDAILEAWRQRLIADEDAWLEAAKSRNLFVHVYDAARAEVALAAIRQRFVPLMAAFVAELRRLAGE